jgi:hypothetical protein
MARAPGTAWRSCGAARSRWSDGRGLPGDPSDCKAAISRPKSATSWSAASTCQTAIQRRVPKFDYKLGWLKRFEAHAQELLAPKRPVVLAGDYNIIPTDLDVYVPIAGVTTRCSGPRSARPMSAAGRAGPTPYDETSRRDDLHLLGLSAPPVRPQRRPAHRPPAAEPRSGAAAGGFGRRPIRPRRRSPQRPRADLDRPGGRSMNCPTVDVLTVKSDS